MIEYWNNPLLQGKMMFRCDRMRASLTTDSCAAMWRKADELSDGTHHSCKLCPIGAVHAGEVAASMSPLKGTLTCARCHRSSMRLIGGQVCVSCYNRQRETLCGRNAKGKAPVKLSRLDARRMRYMAGPDIRTLVLRHTADMDELIVTALRDNKQRVVLAWNSTPPVAIRQNRLW